MESVTFNNLPELSVPMRDSLRALKTNIQFCGDDIRTIMLTSANENEGKTTIAINLARTFADAGAKVAVVETDMRKSVMLPRYHITKDDGNEIKGLAHLLSGQCRLKEAVYATNMENVYFIFAGRNVANATELLERPSFETLITALKKLFDYIIVDCSPVGLVIDAAVVSKFCDGALLVVAENQTSYGMANGAIRQLKASGVNLLGAVLNKAETHSKHYGKYGSYYGYGYGYGYGHDKKHTYGADDLENMPTEDKGKEKT